MMTAIPGPAVLQSCAERVDLRRALQTGKHNIWRQIRQVAQASDRL
jgi:hypothetical protein